MHTVDLAEQVHHDLEGDGACGDTGTAVRVYLALQAKDVGAAACCVAEASDIDLLARSTCIQRKDSPLDAPARQAPAEYTTRGLTAVHVLSRDCTDLALVREVVARTPQALGEKAGFFPDGKSAQWVPIHFAASNNSSVDVLRLLLDVGGADQLRMETNDGSLPIHVAANHNSSVDVLRLLLDVGGVDQLQAKDQDGDLPIHFAASFNSSVDVLRHLLDVGGADQVRMKNEHGALPIHAAAGSNSSVDVLRLLLDVGGPYQLRMKTNDGRLPIYLAAKLSSSIEVARLLLGRGSPRCVGNDLWDFVDEDKYDLALLLFEAGVEVKPSELEFMPRILRCAAARVSASSVLSSYLTDNHSPLGVAVRPLPSNA